MSHFNQHEIFTSTEDDFFIPEDKQEQQKMKFQELGAKTVTMLLTLKRQATSGLTAFKNGIKSSVQYHINNETAAALKKQKEQLRRSYTVWVISSGIIGFISGNICMFFMH